MLLLVALWPLLLSAVLASETVEQAGELSPLSPLSHDQPRHYPARLARILVDDSSNAIGVIATAYPVEHPDLPGIRTTLNCLRILTQNWGQVIPSRSKSIMLGMCIHLFSIDRCPTLASAVSAMVPSLY